MKEVLIINGSPKGKKATSFALLEHVNERIDLPRKEIISLTSYQKKGYSEILKKIAKTTDMILAFPLYVDCIPAMTLDFMENYGQAYKKGKISGKKNLYVIVNCGFPEAEQNVTAMEIMKEFARTCGLTWAYGIGIGMGGMINPGNIPPSVKIVRPVYDKLDKISHFINGKDIKTEEKMVEFASLNLDILGKKLMKVFYNFMGNQGWKQQAGRNGVRHKLDARPYILENI